MHGLYAGFCALAQRDIKKIRPLLYRQLGYMAATFGRVYQELLFPSHDSAFFKALMFLHSVSVAHAVMNRIFLNTVDKEEKLLLLLFDQGLAISGVNFLSVLVKMILGAYNSNIPIFLLLYAGPFTLLHVPTLFPF